jgi:hypothetical protein
MSGEENQGKEKKNAVRWKERKRQVQSRHAARERYQG